MDHLQDLSKKLEQACHQTFSISPPNLEAKEFLESYLEDYPNKAKILEICQILDFTKETKLKQILITRLSFYVSHR